MEKESQEWDIIDPEIKDCIISIINAGYEISKVKAGVDDDIDIFFKKGDKEFIFKILGETNKAILEKTIKEKK